MKEREERRKEERKKIQDSSDMRQGRLNRWAAEGWEHAHNITTYTGTMQQQPILLLPQSDSTLTHTHTHTTEKGYQDHLCRRLPVRCIHNTCCVLKMFV
jgi:hypothetical protein